MIAISIAYQDQSPLTETPQKEENDTGSEQLWENDSQISAIDTRQDSENESQEGASSAEHSDTLEGEESVSTNDNEDTFGTNNEEERSEFGEVSGNTEIQDLDSTFAQARPMKDNPYQHILDNYNL